MEPVRFLERVTITGADNSIDPTDLLPLTRHFPFVEWGLLIYHETSDHPADQQVGGKRRFPSWPWLKKAALMKDASASFRKHPIRFAGHICGDLIQLIAQGTDPARLHDWPLFDRYQLNGHGEFYHPHPERMALVIQRIDRPVIVQIDGVNDGILDAMHCYHCNVNPLFDLSHGGGRLPSEWPKSGQDLYGSMLCGYAGGLSPANVTEQLPRIHEAAGGSPVWIDCETHVRTTGPERFDLVKVESFLAACEPWVIQNDNQ